MAETIDSKDFSRMIAGAHKAFLRDHQYINRLNVFPAPDGDTGTNMMLTMAAVDRAVQEAPDNSGIGALAKRAADSAIMGARGNSGVILSQILRGIARGLAGKDQAGSATLGKSFQYGVLYAYRAVSRPVEGTILSVARGIAAGTRQAVRDNSAVSDILRTAIAAGREAVLRTPDQLPVLKAAGVVDAGGQGLLTFLTGCLEGLEGVSGSPESDWDQNLIVTALPGQAVDLAHPYCTEVLVRECTVSRDEAERLLLPLGESLVLAAGDGMLKVHLHTAHPGAVLETALTWGTLSGIKIDNMAEQHRSVQPMAGMKRELAVIAVAAGRGFAAMMTRLGATIIIDGGATMNPSVEEFVAAVHQSHASGYIILPNNQNIVLAAQQAARLLGGRAAVAQTVNMPQSLAALMAFDGNATLEENLCAMNRSSKLVKTAAITVAARDSQLGDEAVPAGQYIGLIDGKTSVHHDDLAEAVALMAANLIDEETELVSLYYGENLTAGEAEVLAEMLRLRYHKNVEVYEGGQPMYQVIISCE